MALWCLLTVADSTAFDHPGAGSYVNMRAMQHLRAHGDTLPWSPLSRETRQTRVAVDEASAAAKDPGGFERRLLSLVSTLEGGEPGGRLQVA